jgi:hypothetical protein
MKRKPHPLLILGALSGLLLTAAGVPKASEDFTERASADYPYTGMTASALANAMNEIRYIMPVGDGLKIIWMSINNKKHIKIQTGAQRGPLDGGGRTFEFKKIDGKWKKVSEGGWAS